MFLSQEIDIKLCQINTKINIYAAELPPIRVQHTGHVSLSVSRDQYTALPLVGVLMASYVLINTIINLKFKIINKNWRKPKLQLGFSVIVFRMVAYLLNMIC